MLTLPAALLGVLLLTGTSTNMTLAADLSVSGSNRGTVHLQRNDGSERWTSLLAWAATKHDVPADVLRAVMLAESGGDPAKPVTWSGGSGLMGIRPEVATAVGAGTADPLDPESSLGIAAAYLSEAQRFLGSYELAYAAYTGRINFDGTTLQAPIQVGTAGRGDIARYREAFNDVAGAPVDAAAGSLLAWGLDALGVPYVYTGQTLEGGFDCSGLVYWAAGMAGTPLPRAPEDQWAATARISAEELRPGDLVFFGVEGALSHVGIYAGGGLMLHAPREGLTVELTRLDQPWWSSIIVGYGRIP